MVAAGLAWFLLLGGVRAVGELRRSRRGHSDADVLAELTGLPAGVWVTVFRVVGVAALVTAAWLALSP